MSAFISWLVADTEGYKPEQKEAFLRMLKFNPEGSLQIIKENVIDWASLYAYDGGVAFQYPGLEQEIHNAFVEKYKAELEALQPK